MVRNFAAPSGTMRARMLINCQLEKECPQHWQTLDRLKVQVYQLDKCHFVSLVSLAVPIANAHVEFPRASTRRLSAFVPQPPHR